jgi:four helix bundle protein
MQCDSCPGGGQFLTCPDDTEVGQEGTMAFNIRFEFERLEVFQVALEAIVLLDELAAELPNGRGYMRDQLRRAANSIALNIAEGAGEFAPAEKARFYRIARRSATECAGQLLVARRLGLVDAPRIEAALDHLQRVIGMLVTLVRRCGARAQAGVDLTPPA